LKRVHPRSRKKIESSPQPQPEIELSVHMSKFFDTTVERRQSPRTKLAEIAYIGMGPENGGLVLDVSDGGLSFHAVAPVQPAQSVRFVLSLRGQTRIEGAGEVIWTNELRTVCGLRFTSLSSGAREQLNACTNQIETRVAPPEEDLWRVAPAPPQTEEGLPSLARESSANAEPVFAILPADEAFPSGPEARLPWQKPLLFWIAFGLLCAAITVVAFIYGVHIGKTEINSAAQSAANPALSTEPPSLPRAPAPASSATNGAHSVPNAAHTNRPKTNDSTATPSRGPRAEAFGAVASGQPSETSSEAGKSELAAALSYLNGKNGQRNNSRAIQQLWAAVGKGNPTAEVILADLYLYGDSVEKNCEQGRVLLLAAKRSGNAQAKVRLDQLNANGCP
jgi:hypothetical protein